MIDEDYMAKVMADIESRMSELDYAIISKMAKRLRATIENMGEAMLITSSLKNVLQLEASGLLFHEIEQIMERMMPDIKKDVQKAFKDAIPLLNEFEYFEPKERKLAEEAENIAEEIEKPLESAETKPQMDAKLKEQVENAYKRTQGEIVNLTQTTAEQSQMDFINICNDSFLKIKQGRNLNDVIKETIKDASSCGAWVTYPSGHKDRTSVAIARAVRTGINQANADLVLAKCGQVGAQYVRISSHYGARITNKEDYTNHSWWQGQVYKLNWNDEAMQKYKSKDIADDGNPQGFKDFSVCGYGKIEGLCGINCRHYMMMFFPEMQNGAPDKLDEELQKKRFGLEQKQRAMERAIRKQKRLIVAFTSAEIDTKEEQHTLDTMMKNYGEFCRKNKLPRREWALIERKL